MPVAWPNASQERDRLVGMRLDGRYTVRAVHSRGGMGVVYAAVHDELQRDVAIKVLDESWASHPDAVDRFLTEARTASSLTHSNIVDVQDLGRLPDGRPYLVMPLIRGTDLATLLAEEGPQPPQRVASLLQGVAAALDLIHARDLVHHDIKPENLMLVRREDGTEAVLVLDFGIAGARFPRGERGPELFDRGTPEFMPPEATTGLVPDRRGDVYALATVAFELMTGWLPFDSDDVEKLARLKATSKPSSMSEVSGHVFPLALEAVIARGLATRPADRFASAGEFVRRLAQAAGAETDGATPPPSGSPGAVAPVPSAPAATPASGPRRPARVAKRLPTLVAAGGIPRFFSSPTTSTPAASLTTPATAQPNFPPGEKDGGTDATTGVRPAPSPPPPAGAGARESLRLLNSDAPAGASRPAGGGVAKKPQAERLRRSPLAAATAPIPTPAGMGRPTDEEGPTESSGTFLRTPGGVEIAAGALAPPEPEPRRAADAPSAPLRTPDRTPEEDPERDDPLEAMLRRRSGLRRFAVPAAVLALAAIGALLATRDGRRFWTGGVEAPSSAVGDPAAAPITAPEQASPASPPNVATPHPASTPQAGSGAEQAPPASPVSAERPAPADNSEPASVTEGRARASARATSPARGHRARRSASRTPRDQRASAEAQPSRVAPEPPDPPWRERGDAGELARQATDAMLRGELQQAAVLYQRAREVEPSHAGALRGHGLVLERLGRTQEAAAAYRAFLELAPEGPAARKIRERLVELER